MRTRFLLRTCGILFLSWGCFITSVQAQLQVIPGGTNPYNPPTNLISNVLLGAGVTLVGTPVFAGVNTQVGYFNGATTNIGLASGIIMSSGPATRAIGPNNSTGGGIAGDVGSTATDANLTALAGTSMDDICKFDFDFIPLADTLRFRYVFASDEYPEFACASFNDVFGFFISGQRPAALGGGVYNNFNIATIPGTLTPVSIDNINGPGSGCGAAGTNAQYYINNPQVASSTIQYDGFTVVLTATVVVVPCTQYHIKLAIGDAFDAIYDSAVFLEASSFGTGLVSTSIQTAQPDGTIAEGGTTAQVCFSIPTPRTIGTTINYTLGGTATAGVDYIVTPAVFTIPAGQTTGCITITPLTDAVQETTETIQVFVQASPCRRDTFDIDLIDPRIVAPVIPDVSLCTGAAGVVLDASQAVIIPAPKVFSNNIGGGQITCACPGGSAPGPPLISNIAVTGVAGQFNVANAQMRVCVDIAHTNDGDIDMYLINPCGEVLELSTDNGGGGDNMTNTCFVIGQAAPSITTGAAPFTGNFTPEGNWSLFNGCSFNGTWRLQISDDSNPTNGTLNAWSITFPPSYNINYAWSPSTGLTCNNCATPTANPGVNTTYTVTVSDAYGTSVTDNVTITYVANLPAPTTSCGGSTPNSVAYNWATVGGVTGYEVSTDGGNTWIQNGNSTTYSINGVAQGSSNCISVRGIGSCPATISNQCCVAQVSCQLTAAIAAPPIACINGTTTLTATAANNLSAVNYQLGTGAAQNNNVYTGISAGTYTVTIRESGNATCSATASIIIANPTAVSVTIVPASIDSVSCFNGNDGKATAAGAGGNNANYSYAWCNGETGANAFALAAGTCTVIATDANGCTASATLVIGQPLVLQASIVSSTPSACNNGLPTGTATATAVGGTQNYRYLWDGGAATATATGLSVGTHTVTVTDKNGCISTATVVIVQPAAVNVSGTVIRGTLCFGSSDGQAGVTATGGTTPYSFIWDGTITGTPANTLNAGVHTVVATDANGCTGSSTVTITQPTAVGGTAVQTGAVSCFGGNDGDASVTPTGGTAPYTFQWTIGGTSPAPNNVLPAGTHTVTITDTNGCTFSTSVTITEPTAISATATTSSNVTCFGGNNGVGTATVGGGTPPYIYSWDSPSSTNPATNLNGGTHTVTVIDARGCSITATTTVTVPTRVLPTTSVVNNVSCNGGGNGSADAVGVGGTAPYTYLWDNTQTITPATGLLAGLHFVTVTDAAGCTGTASVTITQPQILSVSTALVQTVSCPGLSNGSIVANPLNGTGPYTFSWSNGETVNPATTLTAGQVSVTVTDTNGCIVITGATMTEPTALSIITNTTQSVSCFGGNNGGATATVTGGTVTYTYEWDNLNNTPNPGDLIAGPHSVTVTDARGCTAIANIAITEPSLLSVNAIENTPVTCFGLLNGTGTATGAGGVPPYIFTWTGGLPSLPNITTGAGLYTVTITDANSCTSTAEVTITQPTQLVATTAANNITTCFGAANGSATATVSGGITPYTYAWDNSDPNSIPTTLTAGLHTVVVTDANNCNTSATVIIGQPDILTASATQNTAVTCFGLSDGSANLIAVGGTAPYIYLWDNNDPSANPSNLNAGTHTVLVTDANNCTTTASVQIDEPQALFALANQTLAISCNGLTDGHASVSASGGTQPYTYLWSNGSIDQSPTNFDNGTITCIVTDINGCTISVNTQITEPTLLTATTTATPNSCNGGNDGTATLAAAGGIAPYTYIWSVSQIITPTATDLMAGTYTATVTDANGCIASATIGVVQPTAIVLTIAQTNILCFGNLSGTATVTAIGGTVTSPYTYLWSNSQINATALGLARGNYTVTVTDANGCVESTMVTITDVPPLVLVATNSNIQCNGAQNGLVSVSVQGGTGINTYAYAWNTPNNDLTPQVSNLASGIYTVIVTDSNGCSKSATAQVQEPALLVLTPTVVNINCNGLNTGSVTMTVGGGVEPYQYLWNDAAGQETPSAVDLVANLYTVRVTDANGCSRTASANVSEPTAITLLLSQTSTKCNLSADGVASVAAGGGSGGYTYTWSDATAQTTATATGLTSGIYTVTITDALLCTQSSSIFVTEPTTIDITISMTPVRCTGEATGTATANVVGGTSGNNGGYNYSWTGLASTQNTPTATNLSAGIYVVTVVDANGCYASSSIEVTALSPLNISVQTQVVRCFGEQNGAASVTPLGGTGTYTYVWGTPSASTDSTATALPAGTYIVTVTDGNNCTASASAVIEQPQELLLSNITVTPVSCRSGADGVIVVSPQGGNGSYSFAWNTNPAQNTETATGLIAGTYIVTVTDEKSCSAIKPIAVDEPTTSVYTSINFQEPTCFGGINGTATAVPSGGTITATSGYTYYWNGGQTTQTATNFSAGIYSVQVTDIKGCTATALVRILEPSKINAYGINLTAPSCFNGRDGSASVYASGGTPNNYTYLWGTVPPRAGDFADGLFGGTTYIVTATDVKGCTGTGAVDIPNPTPITLTTTVVPANCFGNGSGTATVRAIGGTPNYTYNWSNNSIGATATGLNAGAYAVTVTDLKGCSATATVTIVQGSTLSVRSTNKPVRCFGEANGYAAVIATGGAPNYSYVWSHSTTANTPSQTDLLQGLYTVTITDRNTCSATITIEVSQPDELTATATPTALRCYGSLDGQIAVQALGGTTPYKYTFVNGTTPSTNATMIGVRAGSYTITVRDVNGCSTTTTATVDEPQQLKVDAGLDATIEFQVDVATIVAVPNDLTATFTWSATPSDTSLTALNNTSPQILVQPLTDTYYYVTATDANGCIATDRVQVVVTAMRRVFVASAFTPDDNGKNDMLYVQGGIGTAKVRSFEVFNRWGERVFASANTAPNVPALGWDGRYKGEAVDPAVFVWTAVIEFADGQVLTYKGDCTVLK